MSALQELDFSYKTFLDQTVILYGESKTGKSTIIVDILYQLKPFVDQIIIISPTDRQNHTYSGKTEKDRIIPLPCIHYIITDKLLKDIWERQEALVAVYTKANNPDIIQKLFNRLNLSNVNHTIDDITSRRRERESEIRTQYSDEETIKNKIEDMNTDFVRLVNMIYKHYININQAGLMKMALSKDEQFTLKYLNMNPRLVLVFDDCTEQLDKFKKHSVIQKIAYQGRWTYITTLVACHTDLNLGSGFKLNAFVSIFTEESCANLYFSRKSIGVDKEDQIRAKNACKGAFTSLAKYQKLAWVREDKCFYRFIATKRPGFIFGCTAIWDFCKPITAENQIVSADNKFASGFL